MAAIVFDTLGKPIPITQNITKRVEGEKTLHVNQESHYIEMFLTRQNGLLSWYFTYNWVDNKGVIGSRVHNEDEYYTLPFTRAMISREALLKDILWPFKVSRDGSR